jgi:Haem-degrading
MKMNCLALSAAMFGAVLMASPAVADCSNLPGWSQLRDALGGAVATDKSGLNFDMWATIVDVDGTVCAVAFSGREVTSQWLNSRVISAQKASTANGFSLSGPLSSALFPTGLALSTANLYSAVQPGGSLFGLQHSNPVDASEAYDGNFDRFGSANDPLVGHRVGGINVFGGGLGLYVKGKRVGGLGLSGDTSCADHNKAWLTRHNLGFDGFSTVAGVSGDPKRPDNIIYDITPNPNGGTGISAGGFGHPTCINTGNPATLPPVR